MNIVEYPAAPNVRTTPGLTEGMGSSRKDKGMYEQYEDGTVVPLAGDRSEGWEAGRYSAARSDQAPGRRSRRAIARGGDGHDRTIAARGCSAEHRRVVQRACGAGYALSSAARPSA